MATRKKTRGSSGLGQVDEKRRYTIPVAAELLSISRAGLYNQIAAGMIATIKEGKRRFVPGSEIVRKSSVSAAA